MEIFSTLLAFCAGNSPVTGEFHAQKPVTRSFDVFWSAPEQTVEQAIETLVIWDAITLVMTSLWCGKFDGIPYVNNSQSYHTVTGNITMTS